MAIRVIAALAAAIGALALAGPAGAASPNVVISQVTVHLYDADILPPLTAGAFNLVQRGQVVPGS